MMHRSNKRIVSCPNLISKLPKSRAINVTSSSSSVIRHIQSQYDRYTPLILGHRIKLSDLFTAVVAHGGYRLVCECRSWPEVASMLGLPTGCTNSSIGLRRIYYQFLFKYEIAEYPDLSDTVLPHSFTSHIPTGDAADIHSDVLPASSVERNLGIALPDGTTPTPGLLLSHQNNSFSEFGHTYRGAQHVPSYLQDLAPRPVFGRDGRVPDDHRLSMSASATVNSCQSDYSLHRRDLTELQLAELSLASGLPNEIEFTLNSLVALSMSNSPNTGMSTGIRLSHCSNLLSLLMASVGLYDDGCGTFLICDPIWKEQSQLNFLRLWHNLVEEPEGRVFLRPDVFVNSDPDDEDDSKTMTELFAPSKVFTTSCMPSLETDEDVETSRALLVCTILVNLVTSPSSNHQQQQAQLMSLRPREEDDDDESELDVYAARRRSSNSTPLASWRENARFLASQPTALRFAFLCAYARHSGLRQLGLQLISSLRYPLDPPVAQFPLPSIKSCPSEWTPLQQPNGGCLLADLTRKFLIRCILHSPDRASLLAGLSFLTKLSTVPNKANEFSLLEGLPQSIWPRLAQLLCLPDLSVVCAVLEAIRSITSLGDFGCALTWHSCSDWSGLGCGESFPLMLVQPLLALLTLEGQAMGSQSLHRIKLLQRPTRFVPLTPQLSQSVHHQPTRSMPISRASAADNRVLQPPSYHAAMEHQRAVYHHSTHHHQPPVAALSPNFGRMASATTLTSIRPSPASVPRPSTPINQSAVQHVYATSAHQHIPNRTVTSSSFHHNLPVPITSSSLVNLLSSTATTTISTTISSQLSTNNTLSSTTVIPTFSSPTKPSLSELTDRLQMPPPSLPPPSALRRSIKSSTKPSSPSTNTVTQSKSPHTSPLDVISSTIQEPQSDLGSTSHVSASDEPSIISCNGIVESDEEDKEVTIDLKHSNVLPNGLSVEESADSISIQSKLPPYVNGLKPELLGAAVEVLNVAGKLPNGSLKLSGLESSVKPKLEEQTKPNDDLPIKSFNGNVGSPLGVDKQDGMPDSVNVGLKTIENNHDHESAIEESLHRNGDDDEDDLVDDDDKEADDTTVDGSDGSSGNEDIDSSATVSSPKTTNRISSAPNNLNLKRRRRWGSRSRLVNVQKRRRYSLVSSGRNQSTSESQSSPLKPLPLQSDQSPESVLGPSWQSPPPVVPNCPVSSCLPTSTLCADQQPAATTTTTTCAVEERANPLEIHPNVVSSFSLKYMCEWDCCMYASEDKYDISTHVYNSHLKHNPVNMGRKSCRWRSCSSTSIVRAPFALMTHVLDVHCCSTELDLRRLVNANGGTGNPPRSNSSQSTSNSPSFGSPSLAGLQNLCGNSPAPSTPMTATGSSAGDQSGWSILRSMETRQMQLDLWAAQHHFASAHPHVRFQFSTPPSLPANQLLPPREGPVTKHLRVTVALILRNLVTHLEEARSWFKTELSLLSDLVMGCSPCDHGLRTNDASSIIAQCLSICTSYETISSRHLHNQPTPTFLNFPRLDHHRRTAGSLHQLRMKYTSRRSYPAIPVPIHNVDLDS